MVWHANLACWEACFSPDARTNLHEKSRLVIGCQILTTCLVVQTVLQLLQLVILGGNVGRIWASHCGPLALLFLLVSLNVHVMMLTNVKGKMLEDIQLQSIGVFTSMQVVVTKYQMRNSLLLEYVMF